MSTPVVAVTGTYTIVVASNDGGGASGAYHLLVTVTSGGDVELDLLNIRLGLTFGKAWTVR